MAPTSSDNPDTALDAFAAARPKLFSIAYRMLGTRADAEDVLQDAWLRWHNTDHSALQSAEAWLVTVVTRLAIDRLRVAKTEREHYVGWWLPEPLVEEIDERTPEAVAELAGELSVALLWVLERLSPEERAAFLMRQAFDQDYSDIAALLGKSEAACRQLVHRATERVQQERPRYEVNRDAQRQLLEKFVHAARNSDRDAMKALMADDIQVVGDGGGKVPAFLHILRGVDRVTNLYWAMALRLKEKVVYRIAQINGEPGLLRYIDGQLESAQSIVIEGDHIVAIYAVRNPDKLAGIAQQI